MKNYLTRAVFLSSTVAEEVTVLSICHIVVAVADSGTHCTHPNTIYHLACMAVIPVLVHELLLGDGKCAQFVAQAVFILPHTSFSLETMAIFPRA